jgi:CHAT domain
LYRALDGIAHVLLPERFSRLKLFLGLFFQVDAARWPDIRLTAELCRDAVGRARMLRQQASDAGGLARGLGDDILAKLAPARGTLAVLESAVRGRQIYSFATCIRHDGRVRSCWLRWPAGLDLTTLSRRIGSRLANWRPGRLGDPFDVPEWRTFEKWFWINLALLRLKPEDHVVVLEQSDEVGLPWHVAAAPIYTASYAPGWSTLLSLAAAPQRRAKAVGVVMVPRFGEAAQVLTAMQTSVKRTEAFARQQDLGVSVATDGGADREAFVEIMKRTDVTKLLCHGYTSPVDGEVALMLAHRGRLPLSHAVASASPVGREHRLSWRDMQQLSVTPRIIFSGACSTGISHTAGLGERLGLFGALRNSGTAAIIAPRWDIVAEAVIPILDEAMERHVGQDEPLPLALHHACAAANQPRWLAWALALEGDWR